jgi:hypothetical protein
VIDCSILVEYTSSIRPNAVQIKRERRAMSKQLTSVREAINYLLIHGNRSDGKPPFHANKDFVARAKKAYIRNKKNPGDCEGDTAVLLGLSIAEAHIGTGLGWIPEVQLHGVAYAEILEGKHT